MWRLWRSAVPTAIYKYRWTLCEYIVQLDSLHQLRAIPAACICNSSISEGNGVGIHKKHRSLDAQARAGAAQHPRQLWLRSQRPASSSSRTSAPMCRCLLTTTRFRLFSTLLEATQTFLHLIGPVLPIHCLIADSMCSFSTVLCVHEGMVGTIKPSMWMVQPHLMVAGG